MVENHFIFLGIIFMSITPAWILHQCLQYVQSTHLLVTCLPHPPPPSKQRLSKPWSSLLLFCVSLVPCITSIITLITLDSHYYAVACPLEIKTNTWLWVLCVQEVPSILPSIVQRPTHSRRPHLKSIICGHPCFCLMKQEYPIQLKEGQKTSSFPQVRGLRAL